MEKREMIAKVKEFKTPQGLIVRSSDGRFFFLSEDEVARKELSHEITAQVAAVFAKAPAGGTAAPRPDDYCGWMLNWLLTHKPLDEYWRRVSTWWMDAC